MHKYEIQIWIEERDEHAVNSPKDVQQNISNVHFNIA